MPWYGIKLPTTQMLVEPWVKGRFTRQMCNGSQIYGWLRLRTIYHRIVLIAMGSKRPYETNKIYPSVLTDTARTVLSMTDNNCSRVVTPRTLWVHTTNPCYMSREHVFHAPCDLVRDILRSFYVDC